MNEPKEHICDTCGKPATDCYREGRGTGHSEHVCACFDHREYAVDIGPLSGWWMSR